jgi:hypothetical protein
MPALPAPLSRALALAAALLLGGLAVLLGPAVAATAAEGPAAPAAAAGQVTWAAAPADTSLGKARSHYAYTLAPGSTLTDAMAVVNRSAATITLRVYASDAFSTAGGGIDLLPADKKPTDVGAWITVKSQQVTLKPQQSVIVPFTIRIPANATPGDHTGGVVTSLVTKANGSTVALDRRLGSRLYLRVTGDLKPALSVGDVKASYGGTVNPFGGGAATLTYTVTNTGNVRLAAHQRVSVNSPFGVVTTTAVLADLPEVLPGDSLTRTVTVKGVWPTTHLQATVALQPVASGDQPPIAVTTVSAEASAWGWPIGQLLLVVLLILLVVGLRWRRRRQASKVDAAIAAAVEKARETVPEQAGSTASS